jgi:hypothetical protein
MLSVPLHVVARAMLIVVIAFPVIGWLLIMD